MNPSTTIQSFVDDLRPEDLATYRASLGVLIDEADAALEEAEMNLKYGGLNVALPPETLKLNALVARITVAKCEEVLHAIQSRITSLKLEGKAPEPATFTANISTHLAV